MNVFVSGPYGDHNPDHVIAANVARADEAAKQLVLAGHVPFCPHKMMEGWQTDERLREEHWLRVGLAFLGDFAQAVLRLPGDSHGADQEVSLALHRYGLPVYYRVEDVGQPGGKP